MGTISWRRAWQPTSVFLPGESHGQRNLAVIVHSVTKSQIQLKPLSIKWELKILMFPRFKVCIYLVTVDFNYKFQYSLSQIRYSPKNSCFCVFVSILSYVCTYLFIVAFWSFFYFFLSCNSDILVCIKILSIIQTYLKYYCTGSLNLPLS